MLDSGNQRPLPHSLVLGMHVPPACPTGHCRDLRQQCVVETIVAVYVLHPVKVSV